MFHRLAFIVLLMSATVCHAQAIPCKVQFPNNNQLSQRLSCLEVKFDNLDALLKKYFDQQGVKIEETRTSISKSIEDRFGPVKKVTIIKGGIYVSYGFWAYRKKPKHYYCRGMAMPKQPAGTIQIGGAIPKEDVYSYDQSSSDLGDKKKAKECVPDQRRDCSGGEYCKSKSRTPGCFVNKDWYNWAVANTKGGRKALSDNVVCALPSPASRQ